LKLNLLLKAKEAIIMDTAIKTAKLSLDIPLGISSSSAVCFIVLTVAIIVERVTVTVAIVAVLDTANITINLSIPLRIRRENP